MNLFFIKCSDEIIIVENSHETSPNFETRSYQVLILSRSSFLTVISNKIEAGLDDNINQISNCLDVVFIEAFGQFVYPRHENRPPADLMWLHVDHTTARNSSGRSDS